MTGLYGSPELGQDREQRSSYPVQVDFIIPAYNKRFYAIPVIGYLARLVLVIPHVVLMLLLGVLVTLLQFFLWVPVILVGRYPKWGYAIVGGYLRWNTRVLAYFFGLTDEYPPFRLRN